ncbi:hypothetical protein K402DRAFT_308281, partial [Aulographum hederae CBS 113979]
ELVDALWPDSKVTQTSVHTERYKSFIEYVCAELSSVRLDEEDFVIRDLNGVRTIIQELHSVRGKARKRILEHLQTSYLNSSDDSVMRSIELTLRLCLTMNIRSPDVTTQPARSNTSNIEWEDESTLDELIRAQFPRTEYPLKSSKEYRIDAKFTAPFLSNIAGIQIDWTDDLAEHLQYNHHRRALKVYQHKICLIHHLESGDSIIPSDILTEAIDTLNLLFPFDGRDTKSFLRKNKKDFYKLGHHGRIRLLDLRKYSYWRHQLCDLIEVSNEPAYGWRQLLKDSRNKVEYWTFWIALVVFSLTVI